MNSIFELKSIEEQLIDHIEKELSIVEEYIDTIPLNLGLKPYTHLSIDVDSKTENTVIRYLDKSFNERTPFFSKIKDTKEYLYHFKYINYEIVLIKSVIHGIGNSEMNTRKYIAVIEFNKLHPLSLIFKDVN